MALFVHKFSKLDELQRFLHGAITGGKSLHAGVYGLEGKTLIFTSPDGTVTFEKEGADAHTLFTRGEIKTEIESVVGLKATFTQDGRLVIAEAVPASGIALADSGTANALLGFSEDGVTGQVYGADITSPPALVSLSASADMGGYVIIVSESDPESDPEGGEE